MRIRVLRRLLSSSERARWPDPAAPDLERLTALAEEHGIEILGPPGTLPS